MERLLRRSGLLLVLLLLLCFLRSRLPLRRFSLRDRVRSLLLVRLDFFGEGDRDRDKTGWLCDLSDEREREGSGDDVTLQIFSDLRRELTSSLGSGLAPHHNNNKIPAQLQLRENKFKRRKGNWFSLSLSTVTFATLSCDLSGTDFLVFFYFLEELFRDWKTAKLQLLTRL